MARHTKDMLTINMTCDLIVAVDVVHTSRLHCPVSFALSFQVTQFFPGGTSRHTRPSNQAQVTYSIVGLITYSNHSNSKEVQLDPGLATAIYQQTTSINAEVASVNYYYILLAFGAFRSQRYCTRQGKVPHSPAIRSCLCYRCSRLVQP